MVLAGGQARRMGGIDKGLIMVAGRPMIAHVLAALAPQVGPILINANRSVDDYATLGYPVIRDGLQGYLGPLAGVLSGLEFATTDFVLTVPCDSPLLAPDLAECLEAALESQSADIAVAWDGARLQPVFMLVRRTLRDDLEDFLASEGRKIDAWFARHRLARADLRHRVDSFINVNDAEERAAVEAKLLARAHAL